MSRFLRFLAEQHLEGHGNQLKESVIAVEVFGRRPDHDPLKDSIVRTEAGRLRGRLAEYYIGQGKDDAIVIELPKGGYTPAFRFRDPAPPPALPDKKIFWRVWLALAAAIVIATAAIIWLQQTDRFWQNPVAEGRFQVLTDFDGTEQAASVSRDGKFVTFLSNRDGNTDVWVTQPGSGQFHNLTKGSAPELVNPSVRVLGFSPDGSLVTFWVRKPAGEKGQIGIWAVPTLGGVSRPYREGVAEFDWSHDGSRLAYHTAASGDPLFISESANATHPKGPIFTAPAGLHSHFPLWGPDDRFIYVVYGALPDKLDIWRLQPSGGMPERITSHNGRVSHPVFLNRHTLIYLATDPDGSGPWLYSIDVNSRVSHRLTSGPDRFTSLAVAADGKRLVVTRASPKSTLWRIEASDANPVSSSPVRIALTPATTFSPRLGPDFLIFVSSTGTSQSIWKRFNGADTELWRGEGAQIIGSPAISPDSTRIAFSVRQHSQNLLYVTQADGTHARALTDSLELRGSPAWTPDSHSITTAANDHGAPHVFQIPIGGGKPVALLRDDSIDPAWQPSGHFFLYSGPDIGTTFSLKAAKPNGSAYSLPRLITLTRGARHLKFLAEGNGIAFLRGEIEHKNLWIMDLETGAERQLTNIPADFNIRDFDISPDGREIVLERVQERSDIVLLDLAR